MHYKNLKKWEDAKQQCVNDGGTLAIDDNPLTTSHLNNIYGANSSWLGGYKDSSGVWKWLNGNLINTWFGGTGSCLAGNSGTGMSGLACSTLNQFICQKGNCNYIFTLLVYKRFQNYEG